MNRFLCSLIYFEKFCGPFSFKKKKNKNEKQKNYVLQFKFVDFNIASYKRCSSLPADIYLSLLDLEPAFLNPEESLLK